MLQATQGTYHDGIVELDELFPGVGEARVLVTLLPEEKPQLIPERTSKLADILARIAIESGSWPTGFTAARSQLYDDVR